MTTEQILQARDGIWRLANYYNASKGRGPIQFVAETDISPGFAEVMSEAYSSFPRSSEIENIPESYQVLKQEIVELWNFIVSNDVEIKIPPGSVQPFPDVETMMFTYAGTKRVAVYAGTNDHPVLSELCPETQLPYQVMLRVIEYFFGHMMGNFDFDPKRTDAHQQEILAFLLFSQLLSPKALKAAAIDLLARKMHLLGSHTIDREVRIGTLPENVIPQVESPSGQINLAL